MVTLLRLLAIAAPTEAQRAQGGDYSVSMTLFETNTGTVFSAGRMFGDRLHGSLELVWRNADVVDDSHDIQVGIDAQAVQTEWLIGPTVKFYGAQSGPVVPYLRGKIGFGNSRSDLSLANEQLRDQDTFRVESSVAIGAEWFPTRGVSFSGHTGFQFSRDSMKRYNEDRQLLERVTDNYGTFRSGVALSFYFH